MKRPNLRGPCPICRGKGNNWGTPCSECDATGTCDRPATDSEMIDLIWAKLNPAANKAGEIRTFFPGEWRSDKPPKGVVVRAEWLCGGDPWTGFRVWNGQYWAYDTGEPVTREMTDVRWKVIP